MSLAIMLMLLDSVCAASRRPAGCLSTERFSIDDPVYVIDKDGGRLPGTIDDVLKPDSGEILYNVAVVLPADQHWGSVPVTIMKDVPEHNIRFKEGQRVLYWNSQTEAWLQGTTTTLPAESIYNPDPIVEYIIANDNGNRRGLEFIQASCDRVFHLPAEDDLKYFYPGDEVEVRLGGEWGKYAIYMGWTNESPQPHFIHQLELKDDWEGRRTYTFPSSCVRWPQHDVTNVQEDRVSRLSASNTTPKQESHVDSSDSAPPQSGRRRSSRTRMADLESSPPPSPSQAPDSADKYDIGSTWENVKNREKPVAAAAAAPLHSSAGERPRQQQLPSEPPANRAAPSVRTTEADWNLKLQNTSFLRAVIFFAAKYERSPEEISAHFKRHPEDLAKALRIVAAHAVNNDDFAKLSQGTSTPVAAQAG